MTLKIKTTVFSQKKAAKNPAKNFSSLCKMIDSEDLGLFFMLADVRYPNFVDIEKIHVNIFKKTKKSTSNSLQINKRY